MFGKEPDSDFFEEMDPFQRLWLYESWAYEQELEMEKMRNHALFIGSFFNPEAAAKIIKRDKPQFKSTEDDFERSYKEVTDSIDKENASKGIRVSRRKRRKIVE